jgi:hypothetical protein
LPHPELDIAGGRNTARPAGYGTKSAATRGGGGKVDKVVLGIGEIVDPVRGALAVSLARLTGAPATSTRRSR